MGGPEGIMLNEISQTDKQARKIPYDFTYIGIIIIINIELIDTKDRLVISRGGG